MQSLCGRLPRQAGIPLPTRRLRARRHQHVQEHDFGAELLGQRGRRSQHVIALGAEIDRSEDLFQEFHGISPTFPVRFRTLASSRTLHNTRC